MSALMHSPFWTALFALDRLNSWLRSEDSFWCPACSTFKSVIYWTKTQAILAASKEWHIGMRRIMVQKPCRRCGGTGLWLPDYYYDESGRREGGKPCRGCRATGTAKLLFIETTIGPLRWHTPAEKWCMSSLDVYVPFKSYYPDGYEYYALSTDWEPNQKGRSLTLDQAERDMLILLHTYPHEVCFSIDYHHHAGLEHQWRIPNLPKAERWIRDQFLTAKQRSWTRQTHQTSSDPSGKTLHH